MPGIRWQAVPELRFSGLGGWAELRTFDLGWPAIFPGSSKSCVVWLSYKLTAGAFSSFLYFFLAPRSEAKFQKKRPLGSNANLIKISVQKANYRMILRDISLDTVSQLKRKILILSVSHHGHSTDVQPTVRGYRMRSTFQERCQAWFLWSKQTDSSGERCLSQ